MEKTEKTEKTENTFSPDGILLVNKPAGITSHDVVFQVRKLYGTRQVGHTGTLDPMATGLLIVLVGRAVKAEEYAVCSQKCYTAGLKLGVETDTEDSTGKILRTVSSLPTEDVVRRICASMQGKQMQVPPMYSALKVGGKKLVDLAREGIEIEREARKIEIFSLGCETVNEEEGEYLLEVSCSKGTYIRTLCADIGKKLGCGGVMSSLTRKENSGFSLSDAHTLEEIGALSAEKRQELLLPVETLFTSLPILRLSGFFARLADCGNEIYLRKIGADYPVGSLVRLYDEKGFFSLAEVRAYEDGPAAKPVKKFRL